MFRKTLTSKVFFISLAILSAIALFDLADGTFHSGYCHAAGPELADVRVGDGTLGGPSIASYKVIITKNLFNPGRTEKWKASTGQPVQSQAARHAARVDMILEGVIIFEGYRVALIREGAGRSGGVTTAVVGDMVGAYKVISIEDEEVVLNGIGGERVLTLFNFDDPARRRHIKTDVRAIKPVPSRPVISPKKVETKANVPHRSK